MSRLASPAAPAAAGGTDTSGIPVPAAVAAHGPVAMIGLGIMGGAIAANLRRAGFVVQGFDPDASRLEAARAAGVRTFDSPQACARGCAVILTSLPSPEALDATCSALLDDEARKAAGLHVVLAELSTLPLEVKQRNRERLLAGNGSGMLDCPISGTGAQAVAGDLVLYASGDAEHVQYCKPVLQAFSRAVHHVGAFGDGMRLKLVANLLVAIHNVAAAEALALARRIGLDTAAALELLGLGAGASRILALRGPMMVAQRFEPATMKLDVWDKDLQLIAALARECGASTPLFDATRPLYAAALAAGLGAQDTAAVYRTLDGSLPETAI